MKAKEGRKETARENERERERERERKNTSHNLPVPCHEQQMETYGRKWEKDHLV